MYGIRLITVASHKLYIIQLDESDNAVKMVLTIVHILNNPVAMTKGSVNEI